MVRAQLPDRRQGASRASSLARYYPRRGRRQPTLKIVAGENGAVTMSDPADGCRVPLLTKKPLDEMLVVR